MLRLRGQENLRRRRGKRAGKDGYGTKCRIRLDHQIQIDHGIFYPQALFNDFIFKLILAAASQVVKGSDRQALNYKLTNVQHDYEMIRSNTLANEVNNANNIVK